MKQRNEIILLCVLAVIAAAVWYFERHGPVADSATATFTQNYKPLEVDNPRLLADEIDRARKTEYKSSGHNPFSLVAPPPPEQMKKNANTPAPYVPPVEPPKPTKADLPANLKFFGYGTVPNGTARRAFFTNGEDVYIVAEGETLLGRYRILRVSNTSLEFEEVSSGLHGTAILEEPSAGPSA
jgi:hypothetical protein